MKKFISKQRLFLIIGGVITFALFSLLSWILKPSTVSGSVSSNLAAGALTISITAAIVDWLIGKENDERNKATFDLVIKSLRRTRFGVEASLGEVYGYIEAWRKNKLNIKGNPSPEEVPQQYLRTINLQNDPIYLEHLPILLESIRKTKTALDEAIVLGGFALKPELKNSLLDYRKAIDDFLNWFDPKLSDSDKHLKNRINAFSTPFYMAMKSFYADLEALDSA